MKYLRDTERQEIMRETGEGDRGRFSVSFLLTEKGDLDKIYHKKR